ncbi:hypothetical protein ACFPOI_60290 [Nonomuraea angiospora]|uniref:Uncharacterized protein n=1 Tax=Nonomuraea angiospora TaxID=46172 RepID=A0ABR9LPW2_9ACTN|nr:hypothetical protein [Nonomuraea angiospora]MBE1582696.1 hypothetical protein [Nonomuraea angiospora]
MIRLRGVDAADPLPEPSPAVELAAHRIASPSRRSPTNVQRHSTTSRCVITLTACPDLAITVRDDGAPPPSSWQPVSACARSSNVPRRWAAGPAPGPTPYGWQVTAALLL